MYVLYSLLCIFTSSIIFIDYREHPNKNSSLIDIARERQIRDTLINSRYIAFTPSRYNKGQTINQLR